LTHYLTIDRSYFKLERSIRYGDREAADPHPYKEWSVDLLSRDAGLTLRFAQGKGRRYRR